MAAARPGRARVALATLALALALGSSGAAQKKLTTLFAANLNGGSGWGVFFDVNVAPAGGLAITAFELNVRQLGTSFTIDFLTRQGTYFGFDHTAAGWTQRTAKVYAAGGGNPSVATFAPPLVLPKGVTGFAIVYHGADPLYNDNQPPALLSYSNADLTINCGVSRSNPFTTQGVKYDPRVWNGSIYYDTVPSPPSFVTWGTGCAGSNGTPSLALGAGGSPKLGTSMPLVAGNLTTTPSTFALLIGASRDLWSGLPLPLDLAVVNLSGCLLFVSMELTVSASHNGGSGTVSVSIPTTTSLLGGEAFLQVLAADPAVTGLPVRLSNAAQVVFGL